MKTLILLAVLFTIHAQAVVLIRSNVVVTNGKCGSANGVLSTTQPKENLCLYGKPSAVVTSWNMWMWTCWGLNGGASANCSAPKTHGTCLAGATAVCPVSNGTGYKTCNSSGAWGSCVTASCNSGYVLTNGACVLVQTSPTPPPTTTATGIPYTLTVNDPSNYLGASRAGVLANFDAAIKDWAKWIVSKGNLRIRMDVTNSTATGRFGGVSGTSVFSKSLNGHNIFEFSGTYKMRTGLDANVSIPDIIITVNADYMRQYYWIDPSPTTRSTLVPIGKTDLVTVFAHELGHGFGMAGWIDLKTGVAPSGISQYDNYILGTSTLGEGKIVFTGAKATANYGRNMPVFYANLEQPQVYITHNGTNYLCARTPQSNMMHYGWFISNVPENDSTFFGLMAGVWTNKYKDRGLRLFVGPLDAAIMGDLGIPMKSTSTALP